MEKKRILQLGRVLKSKAGNFRLELGQPRDQNGNVYGETLFPITLANGVKLNEKDIINLRDPIAEIDGLLTAGRIDAETAQSRKSKIKDFFKFKVVFDEEYGRSKE